MLRFLSFWGQIQASEHTSVTPGRQDGSSFNLRWAGARLFQVYCKNAVLWALRKGWASFCFDSFCKAGQAKKHKLSSLHFFPIFCLLQWLMKTWRSQCCHDIIHVVIFSVFLSCTSFLHSATQHPITETVNVRNQRPEKFTQINQKLKLFSIYLASPTCVYIYSSQDLRGNGSVGDTTLRLH